MHRCVFLSSGAGLRRGNGIFSKEHITMPLWYQNPLTTLAFAWRLERRDGVTLGFTSHDRDLVIDGLTYRATPGMVPSAIERQDSLDPDNVDLAGALTSDAITEHDLAAGRWDGATLRLSAVNWQAPELDPVFLVRGELGTVETGDGRFSVELRGPTSLLEAAVVEETSPECRATLGDKRCRIDLAGRRRLALVSSTAGAKVSLAGPVAADGIYGFGQLRWLDGGNAGLSARIVQSVGNLLTLREPPSFATLAGARVEIVEGCDRRFATCTGRFANATNFRGEPHLPGNDLLVRYA
jgi:uncharacterized phage protein (TIGR02218 family)